MVAVRIEVVPARQRRLRGFSAPDPWAGGGARQWDLNLYRIVMDTEAVKAEWAAIKPAPGSPDPVGDPLPGGRGLRRNEAIGIEPPGSNRYRMLPRALQDAWLAGAVPDARLPDILATLEPRLRRSDFYSMGRRTGLWFAAITGGLVAASILAAALLLLPAAAHVMQYMPSAEFLRLPSQESGVILQGGLPTTPIEPLDAAALRPPPDLKMALPLDTLGWYAVADGSRRLIAYAAHAARQDQPEMSVYGTIIRADRIGLDTARAAAASHAEPTFVLLQHGGWRDAADPTGLAHSPWQVAGFVGLFAAFSLLAALGLVLMRLREQRLRARVEALARAAPSTALAGA